MSRILKVGIIGFGIGEAHLRGYELNPNCKVVSICDFSEDKKEYIKGKYPDIIVTPNDYDIIEDTNIDVVSIASYDTYHFKQAVGCIENDKHVYIEKPVCLYRNEAEKIIKLLKIKPQLKFSSNLVLRTTPRFQNLRNLISNNDFGKLFSIEGSYNYGRIHKLTDGWRGDIEFYSVVYGGGIHLIDLVLWLTGDEVVEVSAYGNNIGTEGSKFKYNDFVVALLRMKSGCIFTLTSNFGCVYPHFHRLNIYGTKLTYENDLDFGKFYKSRDKQSRPELDYSEYPSKNKGTMISSFIDSIINNTVPEVSKEEVFKVMSVCLAIEESVRQKKSVTVEYLI